MSRLRKLMSVVLLSGIAAGALLFFVQRFTTFPLIEQAETYEVADEQKAPTSHHEEGEWHPAGGMERTMFTACATVLSSIGFSALLFGFATLATASLNARKGAIWGIAAFVCIDLAPALGLPPQPPGVAVADLYARQLWWIATVISTALALWLLLDRDKPYFIRLMGLVLVVLPHAVGAPVAFGESSVPLALIHRFALLSILTTGLFWVALGSIGGLLYRRFDYAEAR